MSASPIPAERSLKSICEGIWRVEEQLRLFDRDVKGIRFWYLLRWATFLALTDRFNLYDRSKAPPDPWLRRLGFEIRAIRRDVAAPPWSAAGKIDSVLVPFARKQLRQGRVADVHTERILQEPAFGRFLVLENSDANLRLPSAPGAFVASRDHLRFLAAARGLLAHGKFLPGLAEPYRELCSAMEKEFGVAFPISEVNVALRLALFEESRSLARKMLSRSGARRVFAAWHDQVLFAAARDLGLTSIEIQHAAISRYNLNFHFGGRPAAPYAADRFFAFGPHWIEDVELPANTVASSIGSAHIQKLRGMDRTKVSRRAVAVSNGQSELRLLDSMMEVAALAPDWEFIFKPHPLEDIVAYRARMKGFAKPLPNLSLATPDADVYALAASADVQIGICSTVLFEGMALGCRTIVLKLPGWEIMTGVAAAGDAVFAGGVEDLRSALDSAPLCQNPERYYARPVADLADMAG